MPKIYYISDLHLEFEEENLLKIYEGKTFHDSYLVLAGDICCYINENKIKTFFDYISKKFKRVIYIAGNHEYYKTTLDDTPIEEMLMTFDNIYFLQDEYITFQDDDLTFYGSTLWSRLDANPNVNKLVESSLNDYKYIRNPITHQKITRNETGEMFEYSIELLKDFLATKPSGKIVIVSHHLPLYQVVVQEYKGHHLNSAYASDLHDELKHFNFDCWIFGHTHFSIQYNYVNNDNKFIPFMCNPRGYYNENKIFDEDKFIEF
jgi:predicted phosphodiesterase